MYVTGKDYNENNYLKYVPGRLSWYILPGYFTWKQYLKIITWYLYLV